MNTKKVSIAAIGILVMFLFTMSAPAFAVKPIEYCANGKLTQYGFEPVEDAGAEVVNGNWNVKIMNRIVQFKAFYRERNFGPDEQSPVGTIDEFWIELVEPGDYYVDTSTGYCYLSGGFSVLKKWWIIPDNYMGVNPPPPIYWNDYDGQLFYGDVEISPDGCIIWFWGLVNGPTIALKY